MIAPVALWPSVAGLIFLGTGLFIARKEISSEPGWGKLIALAGVLYAVPLAVFGVEHLCAAESMATIVPAWMPWRIFWAYFVGASLIAAALSLVTRKSVGLSASLTAALLFLFVLLIHLPNTLQEPKDRILLAVALRDSAFAAGALALAGTQLRDRAPSSSARLILVARWIVALAAIYFGIEHFLHPEFAPGVPLQKITPAWVPIPRFWGYAVGAVLLGAAISLIFRKTTRSAATWLGGTMLLLTVLLYLPILLMASGTGAIVEGVNYVADTMLFAGTALLLAYAIPHPHPDASSAPAKQPA